MKKYSKLMAILLVFAMILPGVAQAAPVVDVDALEVTRLEGNNRVETSIEVSKKAFKDGGAKTVVLAGWDGQADALTGTFLAKDKDAPVLITKKDEINKPLADELKRLGAEKVYVLGGETVVLPKTVKQLEDMDLTVERLAGDTRVETSIKIAEEVLGTTTPDEAFVVAYDGLADALAIGPVSGMKNAPILITYKDRVPAETKAAMEALKVKDATIVGGEKVVTPEAKTALEAITGKTVARVAGSNRISTALEIAGKYFTDAKAVVVANGYTPYADALVGGYFAAMKTAPILLSNVNDIKGDVLKKIEEINKDVFVLGGEPAISADVFNQVAEAVDVKVKESITVTETTKLNKDYKSVKVTGNDIVVDLNGKTVETLTVTGNDTIIKNGTIVNIIVGKDVVNVTLEDIIDDGDGNHEFEGGGAESIILKGSTQLKSKIEISSTTPIQIRTDNLGKGKGITGKVTINTEAAVTIAAPVSELEVKKENKNIKIKAEVGKISALADANITVDKDIKMPTLEKAAGIKATATDSSGKEQDFKVNDKLEPTTPVVPTPTPVAVSAININKSTTTLVEGTTETLTVTFTPSNASNKTITWTTSDASKATIDSTGKVRAVSAGTATITAKSNNGKTATCVVTVTTTVVPVSAISVEPTELTLTVGDTGQITATVEPDNAANKNVTWSSSDEDIATVDEDGNVTAVAAGTATITATTVDGGFTGSVQVAIGNVINITRNKGYQTIQEATEEIKDGDTLKLIADISTHEGITVDKNIIFDLNEKTITNSLDANKDGNENEIAIVVKSTVTVKNGTIITNKGSGGIQADGENADLILEDLTIDQNGLNAKKSYHSSAVLAANNAKITIISGNYSAETDGLIVKANGGTVIIEDGTFTAGRSAVRNDAWYGNAYNSLTINSGIFNVAKTLYKGDEKPCSLYSGGSNDFITEVNDGIFNGEVRSEYKDMIINDGTFNKTIFQGGGHQDYYTIYGGTFVDDLSGTLPKNTTVIRAINTTDDKGYETIQEAITDAESGDTINILNDSTIVGTTASNKNLTFVGNSDKLKVTFPQTGYQTYYGCEFTFENLTLNFGDANYQGIQPDKLVVRKCVVNGKVFGYPKEMEFTDCVFNQKSSYNIWTYGSNVTFDNCEFNSAGRSVLIYNEGVTLAVPAEIVFKNCTFSASTPVDKKAAIDIDTRFGSFNIEIENCSASGFSEVTESGGETIIPGFIHLKATDKGTLTVTVDGMQVLADGLTYDADSDTYEISNANGLQYLAKAINTDGTYSGATVKLTQDIKLEGIEWTPIYANGYTGPGNNATLTIDGNGHTISDLSKPLIGKVWSAIKVNIKNLTISGSTIVVDEEDLEGNVGVGAFIGYTDALDMSLENCHLTESTVKGGHWTGGLVGYLTGSDTDMGKMDVVNCSVIDSTIEGKGSVGSFLGHATGSVRANISVDGATVTGNTVTSTGVSNEKAGSLMGTVGAGTVNVSNLNESNNTVKSNETIIIDRIYGRLAGGSLVID